MKKLRQMQEGSFLHLFFACFSLCFLIAAFFMPDRGTMLSGFCKILLEPCKVTTNYFYVGGFGATFLNIAVVGLICTGLCCLPGARPNNVTTLGVILTMGFCTWGIHPLNMLPTILGVLLYCLVKKEKPGAMVNAMLYSTGIAPLISDLLFRYPNAEVVGFNWLGLGLAIFVGLIIGFFLPAGMEHSPAVHKGYDHYSAALPIGMTAFFLRAVLYKVVGAPLPGSVNLHPEAASALIVNVFCIVIFLLFIAAALLMGCTPRDYWNLMKDSGHRVSFSAKYGNAAFLMNVGVFGLFILGYYNLIGANFNGVTFGIILCMLATCNSGSHPRNVWPIMLGYYVTSLLFGLLYQGEGDFAMGINSQAIIIGLSYANGLSPISGKYGWALGALAGSLHYLLVTSVPDLHGGFCLYNGGFTAALICLVLVPQLERFCHTKEERLALKK